jgi:hypothetical protein
VIGASGSAHVDCPGAWNLTGRNELKEKRREPIAPFSPSRHLRLTIAPSASALSAAAPSAIATTTAMPAAPSASTVPAASRSPSTTFLLGPSFIYDQGAAQKVFSVQRFDGFHGVGIISDFRETESARLIRKTIPQQGECIGLNSNFREHRGDLLFRSFERQITEIEFLHNRSP